MKRSSRDTSVAALALSLVLGLALADAGCQPTQCGARNERCCNGACLDGMSCLSDVCRAPCAGPLAACDAVTGTGCEPGATCRLQLSGDTIVAACVAGAPGPGALDTPCASTDECGAGLLCYVGRCRFLCCSTDADCTDPQQFCTPFEGFGLCGGNEGCDVFGGGGCEDGYACYPYFLDGGGATPTCFRPGTVETFEPCSVHLDCRPGHLCIDVGEAAFCLPMCDGAHPCTFEDTGCQTLVGDVPFGVCA